MQLKSLDLFLPFLIIKSEYLKLRGKQQQPHDEMLWSFLVHKPLILIIENYSEKRKNGEKQIKSTSVIED